MITPNHLSVLGIIHTAISILALFAGLYALYFDGRIDPLNVRGRLYTLLTIVTCLSGLPIMRFGHATPGHYLAVVILALLPLGFYAVQLFGRPGKYIQVAVMSTTLFLSFIPAIVESLTRLPVSGPVASSPADPLIKKVQLVLVLIYVGGVAYQLIKLKQQRRESKVLNPTKSKLS